LHLHTKIDEDWGREDLPDDGVSSEREPMEQTMSMKEA